MTDCLALFGYADCIQAAASTKEGAFVFILILSLAAFALYQPGPPRQK